MRGLGSRRSGTVQTAELGRQRAVRVSPLLCARALNEHSRADKRLVPVCRCPAGTLLGANSV